jgi:hypothetical protein
MDELDTMHPKDDALIELTPDELQEVGGGLMGVDGTHN